MILLSIPTLICSIFIITKCINSYILLAANLGDINVMAKKIIEGNVAEILGKIVSISNGQNIKDVSNDKSDDYLDAYKSVNLRRSSKTANSETEESDVDEIIREANRYVIEQLGKYIKERVIEDLVSKFLRNKFSTDLTTNTKKSRIRNTANNTNHKKTNIRYNNNEGNIEKSTESSRESQQLHNKRVRIKNFAKNFNNDAKEILLKRKVTENKPTTNPNEIKRPRYTIKNSVRNKQAKGNEIFVILQPKINSVEKNNQYVIQERNEKKKTDGRGKIKPTAATREFRFIKKTRKEHVTTERNTKSKETLTQKKPNTSDLIYEKIKLNTNYNNSSEYSEKDEKIFQESKSKRIKSNREDAKDKVKVSQESDVVKAVTSYLWVDGEEDDIEQDKVPNEGNSQELSSRIQKSKKKRIHTSPYNYEMSPTIVEKYDFAEPIPEKDRVREVIKTIKKPPSRINKKQKAI